METARLIIILVVLIFVVPSLVLAGATILFAAALPRKQEKFNTSVATRYTKADNVWRGGEYQHNVGWSGQVYGLPEVDSEHMIGKI